MVTSVNYISKLKKLKYTIYLTRLHMVVSIHAVGSRHPVFADTSHIQ